VITTKARRHKVVLLCVFVPLWFLPSPSFSQQTTVWDGVYTAAQAKRGETAYTQYCVNCHKPDLFGIEGAMKGEPFIERRREDNLETLFLDMKATMPRGNPGGLPDQTYSDIISYLLQNNDMPAGNAELKPEVLENVQLVGKDGPKPVPNFVPVLSVGCIAEAADNKWSLLFASEPVRTRDPFRKIAKELQASANRPLGTYTFRLQEAENFGAEEHVGERVQVKGVIVRAPAGTRINVNSIEPIAPSCRN
jgi:S-disulfanyl-L-cysteine oxidoreductase SoxD